MHKLEITLKQHTPIIHFQHDQDGATLRASEVKPKLDRFLLTKLGDGNYDVGVKKANNQGWFIGKGEHPALDYKMFFRPSNNIKINIKPRHENAPMYFGNMGDDDNKDKHFRKADFVEGIILTQWSELEVFVKNNISKFFFIHNFGTRQSKGYGSFTVEKINNKTIDSKFKADYCFRIKTDDWQDALFKTGLFYQSLRSGINIGSPIYSSVKGSHGSALKHQEMDTKFYMKPIVFLYAKDVDKQQWDKKTIKQTYFNNRYYYRKASKREYEEYIAKTFGKHNLNCFKERDYYKLESNLKKVFENRYGNGWNRNRKLEIEFQEILKKIKTKLIETSGLPSQQENMKNSDVLSFSLKKQEGQNYYFDYKDLFGLSSDEKWYSYGADIKKENRDIDRYKSPITFKPVKINGEFHIFILLSDIDDKYLGKVFTIKSVEYKNTKTHLQLQIPNYKSFLFNLFDFIVNNVDIDNCIEVNYRGYQKDNINYYDVLSDIYSQLKAKSQCNTQP